MHCYLHVGTEKTGTTLIQDFLYLNAEKLESLGTAYLSSAGLPNNKWLVLAAFDLDRRDRWTAHKQITTDADLLQVQRDIVTEMQAELAAKCVNALIISSEHIQAKLTRDSELRRLKDILDTLGVTSVSVILYIRDPVQAAVSLYSTSIKSGAKHVKPHLPQAPNYNRICNHKATIELFSGVFGEQNLKVRLFEKSFFLNNSILSDFLNLVGIDESQEFIPPKKANKGLSTLGLELLRRINERIPNLDQQPRLTLRTQMLAYFEKYFSDEKYSLSEDIALAYKKEFQASNEWVRQHFFPEREHLFEPKQASPSQVMGFDAKYLDSLANLLADIWLERERDLLQQASLNDQKA